MERQQSYDGRRRSTSARRGFPGHEQMLCLLNRADSVRRQIKDLIRELEDMCRAPVFELDDEELDAHDEARFRAA